MLFALTFVAMAAPYSISSVNGLTVLKDDAAGIEATIAPREGGELCGLRYRHKGQWVQLIYRACDYAPATGWRGKAPVLWPAVGATGKYNVQGREFEMPMHGFVKDMPWKLSESGADKDGAMARVAVADTPKTRQWYPFGWHLSAEYRLAGGKLTIAYTVTAARQNRGPMPFAIGNHITFQTPLMPGSDPTKLKLETQARGRIVKDANNVPTGAIEAAPFRDSTALGDFVTVPAVGLTNYETNPSMTLTDPQGLRVRMTHHADSAPKGTFVQYNMWGAPRDGYFCPEPWVGLQGGLRLKQGIVELAPGQRWNWTIEIEPSVPR